MQCCALKCRWLFKLCHHRPADPLDANENGNTIEGTRMIQCTQFQQVQQQEDVQAIMTAGILMIASAIGVTK